MSDAEPLPAAAPAGDAPLDEAPVLELRNARETYPGGVEALRGVTLRRATVARASAKLRRLIDRRPSADFRREAGIGQRPR